MKNLYESLNDTAFGFEYLSRLSKFFDTLIKYDKPSNFNAQKICNDIVKNADTGILESLLNINNSAERATNAYCSELYNILLRNLNIAYSRWIIDDTMITDDNSWSSLSAVFTDTKFINSILSIIDKNQGKYSFMVIRYGKIYVCYKNGDLDKIGAEVAKLSHKDAAGIHNADNEILSFNCVVIELA